MNASLGPYVLEAELGRGAFARVFRGRHQVSGAVRALKVLEPGADPELEERFRREGEALARLGGAGVVVVHELGVEGPRRYLVMDLMPGGSLRQCLEANGPMEPRAAAALVARLARTLESCHALGLVHRDLKPENILFDEMGVPRLADFGCVRDEKAAPLTVTGTGIGSPGYMSLEQLDGQPADARADVFALGVILHELVTGTRPFHANTIVALAHQISVGERPRLTPPPLEAIVAGALAADRRVRTLSAAALAEQLEAFAAGKSPRHTSTRFIGLAAILAVSLLTEAVLLARGRHAPSPTPAESSPMPRGTPTPARRDAPDALVPAGELVARLQRPGERDEDRIVARGLTLGPDAPVLERLLSIAPPGEKLDRAPDPFRLMVALQILREHDVGRRALAEEIFEHVRSDSPPVKAATAIFRALRPLLPKLELREVDPQPANGGTLGDALAQVEMVHLPTDVLLAPLVDAARRVLRDYRTELVPVEGPRAALLSLGNPPRPSLPPPLKAVIICLGAPIAETEEVWHGREALAASLSVKDPLLAASLLRFTAFERGRYAVDDPFLTEPERRRHAASAYATAEAARKLADATAATSARDIDQAGNAEAAWAYHEQRESRVAGAELALRAADRFPSERAALLDTALERFRDALRVSLATNPVEPTLVNRDARSLTACVFRRAGPAAVLTEAEVPLEQLNIENATLARAELARRAGRFADAEAHLRAQIARFTASPGPAHDPCEPSVVLACLLLETDREEEAHRILLPWIRQAEETSGRLLVCGINSDELGRLTPAMVGKK